MAITTTHMFETELPKSLFMIGGNHYHKPGTKWTIWSMVWQFGYKYSAGWQNKDNGEDALMGNTDVAEKDENVNKIVHCQAESSDLDARIVEYDAADTNTLKKSLDDEDEGYYSATPSDLGETESVRHADKEECGECPGEQDSNKDDEDDEDGYYYAFDKWPDYGQYLIDPAEETRRRDREQGVHLQKCTWLLMKTPNLFVGTKMPELRVTSPEGEVLNPTTHSLSSWADLDDDDE